MKMQFSYICILPFFFKLMEATEEGAPKSAITGDPTTNVIEKKLTINGLTKEKSRLR